MIQIDTQLIEMYKSLEKLDSLDRHYYKKDNYKKNDNRYLMISNIIESNKLDLFNSCSSKIHNFNKRELNTLPIYDYLLDRVGMLDFVNSYRFQDSFRKKTQRLKKRVELLFTYDNLFFITFTFDDRKLKKDLKDISQRTLRQYVTRWLKQYGLNYVGNIDFGGKNGRLHFHALVSIKNDRVDNKTWSYGAINFKKVNNKNSSAIALYINKLCSHALKESTKYQYLIYPKIVR